MTTSATLHQKTFRFRIEADGAIGTLEGALAIVRRLGLDLRSLRTTGGLGGLEVSMRIASEEEGALLLCRQRLHNVIGILAIRETPALVAGEASTGSGERPEPDRQCETAALYAFK
ncbi:hypothetical protein [Rugamonas apoptosis]|uniref:ACT domain-containing protein n=1 Tax=Rugamonas apoptosis TaxID=2758570 RepID=A0A7W2IKG3_9BURK|nr:hypothetical protein [Rugamonas apoptosis]MBA5687346.1 hypothetical protein [Rugamonas apoptosis]